MHTVWNPKRLLHRFISVMLISQSMNDQAAQKSGTISVKIGDLLKWDSVQCSDTIPLETTDPLKDCWFKYMRSIMNKIHHTAPYVLFKWEVKFSYVLFLLSQPPAVYHVPVPHMTVSQSKPYRPGKGEDAFLLHLFVCVCERQNDGHISALCYLKMKRMHRLNPLIICKILCM